MPEVHIAANAARDELLRLATLERTGILDTPAEPRFDAIVAAVRALLDVPIALVSLVDRDRQWFKASAGVDMCETAIDTSVCALAIRQPNLFVIHDLASDPRTAQMSLVTGDAALRFYAGFPIVTGDGVAIGSVCAIDTQPRPRGVQPEQAIALEALARQAAVEIERGTPGGTSLEGALPFSVGSWDWDIVNDRMTADARYARLLGVDAERASRGVTLEQFLTVVHRDDVDRVRHAIAETVAGRASYACEYRIRRADGSSRWVMAQGRLVRGLDGAPRHFPGAVFDIDARRSQELRLAALVELNDRLRDISEPEDLAFAASEILGRTLDVARVCYGRIDPQSETIEIGRNWTEKGAGPLPSLLHFREYGTFIDDLKRGETVTIGDVAVDPRTAAHADAIRALDVTALVNLPIMEDGRLVAMLVVNDNAPRSWSEEELAFVGEVAQRTRHAVERRRIETELAQLNAQLEAQVEARTTELMVAEENLRQSAKMEAVGQLTGGLAHDFNNLLTGVSGAIEMIRLRVTQGRTGELDRYTAIASEAVTRAAALTHRLLAFSRRQTLDPKPTDANRLVSDMVEMIRRTVGPMHPVDAALDDALWTILVDPNQLENALLNLCINARDAMPDGGPIVLETANHRFDLTDARARRLVPGDYVSLCVTDTGTGMSEDVKARAFDPFYTTKPLGEGTGLGLSMIYGFVRQSGGQVRIDTEVGRGTTMCLYLPRHIGDPAIDPREDQVAGILPIGDAQRRSILVVDDEPAVRQLVAEALGDLGHRVVEAGDGAGALLALDALGSDIDLLVTDVGLPGGMNGRQVADAALARLPELKVVFITGYAEQAVIGGRQLGPNMALLTKPFALDILAARVRSLLDS
ncbi:MAG: GAF domain-containing protein [Pseudomonadota bacterium]